MRLIVGSIVGNEKDNYLEEWLTNVKGYADLHIVIDDASTDGSNKILKASGAIVTRNKKSLFKTDEAQLRTQLWEKIRAHAKKGDWIFIVDSDEFYDSPKAEILANCKGEVAAIKLCDMWSEEEYRIDGYWSPYFCRLFEFRDMPYDIIQQGLHTSPIPHYAQASKEVYVSSLRCRHMAYVRVADRKRRYDFYLANVKDDFNLAHAKSIVKVPTLKSYTHEYPEIMIASLIHNREWILPKFLRCLNNIDYPKDKIRFCFVVNNNKDKSIEILKEWNKEALIMEYNFETDVSGADHQWTNNLLGHMAIMRNQTLKMAEKLGVEYMINIDSDILFPPKVVKHLIDTDKKIISPVFWARWNLDKKLPQVWERGGYEFSADLLSKLNSKGIFEVGGLGAFTCIHRDVWEAGVNYTRVDNLPSNMQGEDRDFCVRARVLGFDLRATNYFDLIHVDDKKMLAELEVFAEEFK